VATLVEGVEGGHDHDADPLQHHCDRTGEVVNLGVFSRKRAAKQEATNTVLG
jgi:sarcosine oxidase subunit beta